ncbi:MAG: hypothetical protein HC903_08820 [Methylacidiphilales bacterium]|nr:hypothetical protein [Candidatus Methylacidiphilales bacterium]
MGARNFNLTPISPGLVDTIISWNSKPLFLWDSNLNSTEYQNTKLIVREFDTQKQVWESNIDINQKKAVYNSKEQLRPGTLYVWLIEKEQEKEKSNLIEPTLFRIMSVKERKKIDIELQELEKKYRLAGVSPEEIELRKTEYFLNYQFIDLSNNTMNNLWSDALTSLFSVEKPSQTFIELRENLFKNIKTSSLNKIEL